MNRVGFPVAPRPPALQLTIMTGCLCCWYNMEQAHKINALVITLVFSVIAVVYVRPERLKLQRIEEEKQREKEKEQRKKVAEIKQQVAERAIQRMKIAVGKLEEKGRKVVLKEQEELAELKKLAEQRKEVAEIMQGFKTVQEKDHALYVQLDKIIKRGEQEGPQLTSSRVEKARESLITHITLSQKKLVGKISVCIPTKTALPRRRKNPYFRFYGS